MSSKNDITGDSLVSKELSPQGKENWDKIFKPTHEKAKYTHWVLGEEAASPKEIKYDRPH